MAEELSARIAAICPGATVRFGEKKLSIALKRTSTQSQSDLDGMVLECGNVVGSLVNSINKKPKRMPQVPGLTSAMLTADIRLRALEDASRVLCIHTEHSPPVVDLVYLKNCAESWVLMESYLKSLEVITQTWPCTEDPENDGRVHFVRANTDFFRAEVSKFNVSLEVPMDTLKCYLTGESANVHRAARVLSGIVCYYAQLSSTDPAATDAVLRLLAVLERNNQPSHSDGNVHPQQAVSKLLPLFRLPVTDLLTD